MSRVEQRGRQGRPRAPRHADGAQVAVGVGQGVFGHPACGVEAILGVEHEHFRPAARPLQLEREVGHPGVPVERAELRHTGGARRQGPVTRVVAQAQPRPRRVLQLDQGRALGQGQELLVGVARHDGLLEHTVPREFEQGQGHAGRAPALVESRQVAHWDAERRRVPAEQGAPAQQPPELVDHPIVGVALQPCGRPAIGGQRRHRGQERQPAQGSQPLAGGIGALVQPGRQAWRQQLEPPPQAVEQPAQQPGLVRVVSGRGGPLGERRESVERRRDHARCPWSVRPLGARARLLGARARLADLLGRRLARPEGAERREVAQLPGLALHDHAARPVGRAARQALDGPGEPRQLVAKERVQLLGRGGRRGVGRCRGRHGLGAAGQGEDQGSPEALQVFEQQDVALQIEFARGHLEGGPQLLDLAVGPVGPQAQPVAARGGRGQPAPAPGARLAGAQEGLEGEAASLEAERSPRRRVGRQLDPLTLEQRPGLVERGLVDEQAEGHSPVVAATRAR